MEYLFAAAAVVWLGMLATVVSFMGRQTRLTREIEDLKRTIEELAEGADVDREAFGQNGRESEQ